VDALVIAVFRRSSYLSHLPFPSTLGRHLFDKFSARAQHELSIYFDSGLAMRREISKILLLLL